MTAAVSRRHFVGCCSATAVVMACAARAGRAPATARPAGTSLRVLTLNLAHGRGRALFQSQARSPEWFRDNLDEIAIVLRREAADVVALQEAEFGSPWAGSFDHVAYLAQAAGYPTAVRTAHVRGYRGRCYGTALLTRSPVARSGGYSFVHQGPGQKGFTWADLGVPPVTIVSVHLDFSRAARRREQANELIAQLKAATHPLVILGDFNSSNCSPMGAVAQVVNHLGLHTWTPKRAEVTYVASGRSLDWILAGPSIHFVQHRVLRGDRISDHRAAVADLVT